MDTSGKWEVVGKPNKKTKANVSAGDSKQKSSLDGKSQPLSQSAVAKAGILSLAGKFGSVPSAAKNEKKVDDVSKKQPVQKKKETTKEKPKEITNLDEAVAEINLQYLQSVLEKTQSFFPDKPIIWLKDLASVVTLKLEQVPELDVAYESHPADFPKALLSFDVETFLEKLLYGCSLEVLKEFFNYCLNAMLEDMKKGHSTYGYRIFIQMLCDILVEKGGLELNKFVDLLKANQAHPQRCLAIMWVAGQLGFGSLSMGLKVWLEVMLPCLNKRAFSSFVMKYLEDLLLGENVDLKQAFNIVSIRHFFVIFDLLFTEDSKLSGPQQQKLMAVYPKIKVLAFNVNPETSLRTFFPSFLTRITQSCSALGRNELLSCLEQCLIVDKHSFIIWQKTYADHLKQSLMLLKHIVGTKAVRQRLDKGLFKETLVVFETENRKLMEKGVVSDSVAECDALCKQLLLNAQKQHSSMKWLFIAAAVLGSIILVLVLLAGNSKVTWTTTNKWLEESGAKGVAESALIQTSAMVKTSTNWLSVNLPIFYATAVKHAGPYVELFFKKILEVGVYLAEISKPIREIILAFIYKCYLWIDAQLPVVWEAASLAFNQLYLWLQSLIVFLLNCWQHVSKWLTENILVGSWSPENLYRSSLNVLLTLQSYCNSFIQWALKTIGQQ